MESDGRVPMVHRQPLAHPLTTRVEGKESERETDRHTERERVPSSLNAEEAVRVHIQPQ